MPTSDARRASSQQKPVPKIHIILSYRAPGHFDGNGRDLLSAISKWRLISRVLPAGLGVVDVDW